MAGVLAVSSANAQDIEKIREKYKGERTAYLDLSESINFSVSKGDLKVIQTTKEEQVYLDDKIGSTQKGSVSYSSFYKIIDESAETLIPKGNGKFKTQKVKDFSFGDAGSQSVFYDDTKEMTFYYEGVEDGAITKLEYSMEIVEPRLLGPIFLQSFIPTQSKVITVTFPEEVKISYTLLNAENIDVKFTETKNGKLTEYKWVVGETKALKYEYNGPNPRYYMPQLHIMLNSVNFDGYTKTYLGSVADLHKWYRDLIVGYNDEGKDETEIKTLVDSITQGLTTDKEKVRAIYYWVQDHIKYIAFEDNLNGFIPRPPAKVCSRRFGDCKDMASIIVEMCKQAGVEAYLTWIGTRDIPYRYEEVPTASADNHMIATWFDENDRPYFLDATAKYMEFGVAPDHIQGKEALVSLGSDKYRVVTVPYADKTYSQIIDTSWVKIDGKDLDATAKRVETGYFRNYSTYYLINDTEKEKKDHLKRTLQKGNNKFQLEDEEIENLDKVEDDLVVNYTYKLPEYLTSYGDEIYVDLNLFKNIGKKIDDDREVAVDYPFKKRQHYVFVLEIPEDMELTYIPKDFEESIPNFTYSITYKKEGNKLIYNLILDRDVMIMDTDSFDSWNELYQNLNRSLGENLVFKKKK